MSYHVLELHGPNMGKFRSRVKAPLNCMTWRAAEKIRQAASFGDAPGNPATPQAPSSPQAPGLAQGSELSKAGQRAILRKPKNHEWSLDSSLVRPLPLFCDWRTVVPRLLHCALCPKIRQRDKGTQSTRGGIILRIEIRWWVSR